MTTIVYRKGIGLLGDKRGIGSDPGYTDTVQKLFTYKTKENDFYLGTAGTMMIPAAIYSLLGKHFEESFTTLKLYDLQKEFSQINFDKTYDYILIVTNKKDTIKAFHINNNNIEESKHAYCASGSGALLIDGILLAKPDISNKELFKLIASHDIYTSEVCDFIPIH